MMRSMEVPAGLVITITDVRRAGFCAGPKTRRWFEGYGFNFRDVVRNGIDALEFLGTGDAHARRVVAAKLAREQLEAVAPEVVITADDVRQSKKCMAGAREFAALHGYDYRRFLAEGIPAHEILKTGDPEGAAIVRDKLERLSG